MGVGNMAGITIKGFDSTLKNLNKLGNQIRVVEEEAVRAGAALLADDIRSRLEGNLVGSEHSTGDLLASFGVTPPRMDEKGSVDVKIGFHGYDRKGAPNVVKARVMESGSVKQVKRPFFRPAVTANRRKVRDLMDRIVHENIAELQKED